MFFFFKEAHAKKISVTCRYFTLILFYWKFQPFTKWSIAASFLIIFFLYFVYVCFVVVYLFKELLMFKKLLNRICDDLPALLKAYKCSKFLSFSLHQMYLNISNVVICIPIHTYNTICIYIYNLYIGVCSLVISYSLSFCCLLLLLLHHHHHHHLLLLFVIYKGRVCGRQTFQPQACMLLLLIVDTPHTAYCTLLLNTAATVS